MTRQFTLAELNTEIEIIERDRAQLYQQRRELLGTWVPGLREGSRSAQILDYLRDHGECSPIEIARACGMPSSTANGTIRAMLAAGQVRKAGRGKYALEGYERPTAYHPSPDRNW